MKEQTDAMRTDVRTGAREGAIDRAAKYYSETQNLSQTLTRVYEAGYAAALEAGKAVDENGLGARAEGNDKNHSVSIYQDGELIYMVYVTPGHAEKFADAINNSIGRTGDAG
jgi:hypothetical protein